MEPSKAGVRGLVPERAREVTPRVPERQMSHVENDTFSGILCYTQARPGSVKNFEMTVCECTQCIPVSLEGACAPPVGHYIMTETVCRHGKQKKTSSSK